MPETYEGFNCEKRLAGLSATCSFEGHYVVDGQVENLQLHYFLSTTATNAQPSLATVWPPNPVLGLVLWQ